MSLNLTTFSFPTPTLHGPGGLGKLPEKLASLGVLRPLVVTDGGLVHTDAFRMLAAVLGEASRGTAWHVFSGVHPNPVEADVIDGARIYRERDCDGIVAFGGGSALDVGKAIRLLIKRPELKLGEFRFQDDWRGLAPCVCVPTTAGTGSEVGRSSVITLAATGRKAVLFHPELLADFVILDPQVTVGLPSKLTAATGIDALTHCIESYTCPTFHPMCDGVALEGIHLISRSLERACSNGGDLEARGQMLAAAAMGAVAFQKDLGATHSLAHPLSTIFGMHHGLANALCLPFVMEFNSQKLPGLYRRIAIACGLDVARRTDAEADALAIQWVRDLLGKVGIELGLKRHGVNPDRLEDLVAQAVDDPCHKTNPVPVAAGDLRGLYLKAM